MSHQFETGFFVRQPAWHRLGVLLPESPSVAAAISLAGLDWTVRQEPIFIEQSESPIQTHRAVVRSTDQKVLGVVGQGYRPLQNVTAFNFFDPFVTSGACTLEAAGSLREGRRVWILARVKSCEAEVVEGDKVQGYFLLSNSHDGTQAVRAQFTTIRVVCMNTLGQADRQAEKGFEASLRVRHTGDVEAGLVCVQKATDMLGGTFAATFAEYQRMAAKRLPIEGLKKYVERVFEITPEMQRQNQMPLAWPAIQGSYFAGPGANIYRARRNLAHSSPLTQPGYRIKDASRDS